LAHFKQRLPSGRQINVPGHSQQLKYSYLLYLKILAAISFWHPIASMAIKHAFIIKISKSRRPNSSSVFLSDAFPYRPK